MAETLLAPYADRYHKHAAGGEAAVDHGVLTGLADDDHPQYPERTGAETISGLWTFSTQPSGIDHTSLGSIGSNTHAQIDTHIGGTAYSQHTGGLGTHTHQSAGAEGGQLDHGAALTELGDDDHTQYALLLGRSTGQTLIGGIASGENLILASTLHATKGKILFGTSAYDEVNNRLGIRTTSPGAQLEVLSSGVAGIYINSTGHGGLKINAGSGYDAQVDFFEGGAQTGQIAMIGSDNSMRFWVAATRMTILSTGNVGFGTTGPQEILTLPTAGKIGWEASAGVVDVTLARLATNALGPGAGDSLRAQSFTAGLRGWSINADGDAEFANISVRGELHASVFSYNEMHATAGTLGIFKSAGKLRADVTTVASPTTFNIDIEDPDTGHAQLFAVNDILRIKSMVTGGVGDNFMTVQSVSDQTTFYRYVCVLNSGTATTFTAGAAVVDYGQSGQGYILQSADLLNNPWISLRTHSGSPWSAESELMRMGNLNGNWGYAADTYGLAIGQYLGSGSQFQPNITIDTTNGLRIRSYTTTKIQIDTAGNATIEGTFSFGTDGGISINSGNIVLNTSGIRINATTSIPTYFEFKTSGDTSAIGIIWALRSTSGAAYDTFYLERRTRDNTVPVKVILGSSIVELDVNATTYDFTATAATFGYDTKPILTTLWGNAETLRINATGNPEISFYRGNVAKWGIVNAAADDRLLWWSYTATAGERMRLSTAGVLGVDASGVGTAAQVDLFDDYDDAIVLRQGLSERQTELLERLGIMEKKAPVPGKGPNPGYWLNLQPMLALLAGGVYQTRQRLDNYVARLEGKVAMLERRLALLGT